MTQSVLGFIENAVDEVFASEVTPKLIRASGLAMRDIRNEIIEEWFGGFNSASMIKAWTYPNASGKVTFDGGSITVRTHVAVGMYNPNQEIQEWNTRNQLGIASTSLMEYVLDLQLYHGIIGLPASGTLSPEWTNSHFHQKNPLMDELTSSKKWKNFIKTMISKF